MSGMKPRHAAALALVGSCAMSVMIGCLPPWQFTYYPDKSAHTAGYKCPPPEEMSHFVASKTAPCTWIPGEMFVASCWDEELAALNEARGCVPEPSPTPTATPTSTATPTVSS